MLSFYQFTLRQYLISKQNINAYYLNILSFFILNKLNNATYRQSSNLIHMKMTKWKDSRFLIDTSSIFPEADFLRRFIIKNVDIFIAFRSN